MKSWASMVQGSIAQEVRDSGEFSVLADETKDCRKMEQMAVVLQYFRGGSIYESFVGFVQVSDLSAEGLSSKLIAELQKLKIDYKTKLIGQGYDGASVVSGKNAGVAKLMQKEAPLALYVHCHAHRLNLALVDCVKSVPAAAELLCSWNNCMCLFLGHLCMQGGWKFRRRCIAVHKYVNCNA